MEEIIIYSKNGQQLCKTHKLEYNGDMMGERSVTVTIHAAAPLNLTIGCYLTYRGERFVIEYDPSVSKRCQPNKIGDAFVYQDVRFKSEQEELVDCRFRDIVLGDNQLHYTSLPNFSFYAETMSDLADRLQANLDVLYTGANAWKVTVVSDPNAKTKQNVSVTNQNCWEVLANIHTLFESSFMIDCVTEFQLNGYTCHKQVIIGKSGDEIGVFKFGRDTKLYATSTNGICELRRNTDDGAGIVTRLRAYGNTTNLPYHYYHNINCVCYVPGSDIRNLVITSSTAMIELLASSTQYKQFTNETGRYVPPESDIPEYIDFGVKIRVLTHECDATMRVFILPAKDYNFLIIERSDDTDVIIQDIRSGNRINFIEGENKNTWVQAYKDYTGSVPNNFAVNNLMLPNFGVGDGQTLDPYIDSTNISQYGIREASIFFDGTEDREDIYPTIEEITYGDVKSFIPGMPYDDDLELDTLKEGSHITDRGIYDDGEEVVPASFTVKTYNIGFDINDYATENGAKISFKDGMLGGRTFNITGCEQNADHSYTLTCTRVKDDSTQYYYPNNDYNAAAGDHFVLVDIYMPDIYVQAAAQRLQEAAEAWLDENDDPRYTYEPSIDNVFMARQHDWAVLNEETSYHDIIKEGQTFGIEDTDLDIDVLIPIKHLTITEQESRIPQYKVTLDDEVTVGLIQRVMSQVDTKFNTATFNISKNSTTTILKDAIKEGKKHFLSKEEDDIAQGHIQFNSGATFKHNAIVDTPAGEGLEFGNGSFQPGVMGAKIYKTADGTWKGEFDHLAIHGKLETEELEVMHVSHIGGKVVNTAASMTCSRVVPIEDAYVCFFNDENEDVKIRNLFVVNDQAFCETFNVDEGTTEHFSNTYYWRLVTAVSYTADGTEVDTNGIALAAGEYTNCIVLSDTDKASGSTVPSVGDYIVQLGNRTTSSRQGAIIQASAERVEDAGNSTPYINFYKGIGYGSTPYVLPNPIIRLAPDNTIISASSIVLQNNQSVENAISSIQNNQFLIWQNSLDAPKEDETTTPVESISPEDTEPSDEWTTDEYPEHVGDYLVFADGIVYKFVREMGAYQWSIVTDTYLVAYITRLGNMETEVGAILDDDKVDLGEKTRLLQLIEEIDSQASEVNNQYEAIENKSDALESAKQTFDECVSYLVDADEGILAIIAGVTDEDYPVQLPYEGIFRDAINEGIANFASALTAITSLLSEGSVGDKLLETGIDIGKRTITVTSDNFKIQNNSGSNTFYVDKDGNVSVYGAINRSIQTIDISDEDSVSKYCRTGIASNKPDEETPGFSTYKAIDVLSYEGVFEFVRGTGDTNTTKFYLPYLAYIDTGIELNTLHYQQTKSTANFDEHGEPVERYITKKQLRQILGRKFWFYNNTEEDVITIDIGARMGYSDTDTGAVESRTIYLCDDNGYYMVYPTSSYPRGGKTYFEGDITIDPGECLQLELCYGSIKESPDDLSTSGYYWRYNLTTDEVDFPEDE